MGVRGGEGGGGLGEDLSRHVSFFGVERLLSLFPMQILLFGATQGALVMPA